MQTLISCEQVFEKLTAGPFSPQDPGGDDVEMHLAVCHECRQFAEALKPATEVLCESLGEESSQLHCYPAEYPEYTARVMRQIRDVGRQTGGRRLSSWAIGQFLLTLVAAAAIIWMLQTSLSAPDERTAIHAAETNQPKDVLKRLEALELHDGCLVSMRPMGAAEPELLCCTSCHSASRSHLADAVQVLQAEACVVCHTSDGP